jgi:15-cis-phytoene synthase
MNSIVADGSFSDASMQKHGKTFYWASFLLGRSRSSVMRLYGLCRYIDDLADNAINPHDAKTELDKLSLDLIHEFPFTPFVREALVLKENANLPKAGLVLLLNQVSKEHPFVQPRTEADLLEYAFGVAGSVGYMMRPMLGCRDPNADRPAVALGIAMQLTNIARDIGEDSRSGRVYIPSEWKGSTQISHFAKNSAEASRNAHQCALQLLSLAEKFYAYAEDGIPLLPWYSRLCIRAALQMYREIGQRIKELNPETFLQTRAYVGTYTKCWLLIRSLIGYRVTTARECASSQMWPAQVEKALQSLRQHEQE